MALLASPDVGVRGRALIRASSACAAPRCARDRFPRRASQAARLDANGVSAQSRRRWFSGRCVGRWADRDSLVRQCRSKRRAGALSPAGGQQGRGGTTRSPGLSRGFRRAQAFAVHPGAVEAANASLPAGEHRAGILDATRARLCLLRRGDPVNPITACDGRDVLPHVARALSGRPWRAPPADLPARWVRVLLPPARSPA